MRRSQYKRDSSAVAVQWQWSAVAHGIGAAEQSRAGSPFQKIRIKRVPRSQRLEAGQGRAGQSRGSRVPHP
jgi:hypothetical protein